MTIHSLARADTDEDPPKLIAQCGHTSHLRMEFHDSTKTVFSDKRAVDCAACLERISKG
jgi:hypothetical protein